MEFCSSIDHGTGNDEDVEVHIELMRDFFHSLSQSNLKHRDFLAPGFSVRLALQGDQFSRWNVQHIARDSNFLLESVWLFDFEQFPTYTPARNEVSFDGQSDFPVNKPRVYNFSMREVTHDAAISQVVGVCQDLVVLPITIC